MEEKKYPDTFFVVDMCPYLPYRTREASLYTISMLRSSRSRTGFTLVGVLVAGVLLVIVGLALAQLMKQMGNSTRRLEKRSDLNYLRQTLSELVDCQNTLTGVNTTNDCFPSGATRKALTLKNKDNAAITSAIVPVVGTFDPLDSTFQGSGSFGEYELRAYCDTTLQSLVVRVAKKKGTEFFVEQSTQMTMDWQNRLQNPILGTTEARLCVTSMGGTSGAAGSLTLLPNPPVVKFIGSNTTQLYADHMAAHAGFVSTTPRTWSMISVIGFVPLGISRVYAKAFCSQATMYSSGDGQGLPPFTGAIPPYTTGSWRPYLVAHDGMLFASAIDNTWDTATKIINLYANQSFRVMVVEMQADFACSVSLLGYYE